MSAPLNQNQLIPTRFQIENQFRNYRPDGILFDRMTSPFYEGEKWAVRRLSDCLNKSGKWEHEPLPSSRDDVFFARCRFDSLGDAIAAFNKFSQP